MLLFLEIFFNAYIYKILLESCSLYLRFYILFNTFLFDKTFVQAVLGDFRQRPRGAEETDFAAAEREAIGGGEHSFATETHTVC